LLLCFKILRIFIKMKGVFCSLSIVLLLLSSFESFSQMVPGEDSNISALVTFGKDGAESWGDDDFVQIFFFVVPKKEVKPVYIRVFDPECSGNDDEKKVEYNTETKFSVYGGKTCFTNKNVQNQNPVGNYNSGNLLSTKTFGNTNKYEGTWYTFGPFNPTEGEYAKEYGGYIFKVIAEGISGDDGNLYKYYFSSVSNTNKAIEGGNVFAFEYTCRLSDKQSDVAHIYPFVDEKVVAIKINGFDFDSDGNIKVVSVAKKGDIAEVSADNTWMSSEFKVVEKEKKTSFDIQLVKSKTQQIKNNNVTIYVANQYGHLLPMATVPIGGAPKTINVFDPNAKNKVQNQSINDNK